MRAIRLTFLILAAAVLLTACGGKAPREPASVLDTPQHHYKTGMRLLDAGDLAAAERSFDAALGMREDFSPALAGKGLVQAERGNMDEALDLIDDARDEAANADEQVLALVAEMRARTVLAWKVHLPLDELVEDCLELRDEALEINPRAPGPYFYMGEAYMAAMEFGEAERMFSGVLLLENGMEEAAEQRWQFAQKVRRAAPHSPVGKQIALVDVLTRADMAALLVEELRLERLYQRTGVIRPSGFQTPEEQAGPGPDLQLPYGAKDAREHPFREDVKLVLELGVMGLTNFPDKSFLPGRPVTRAELAMILEDILVRATGEKQLATAYLGETSPFSDVRNDLPYFNAIMLTTTRGLMRADLRTGRFDPMAAVPGVDAVLAVHRLETELQPF